MKPRCSLATMALAVAAMSGCAQQGDAGDGPQEPPAEDQPLDLTVDSLDVVHGALRLSATMVDGAADVSVRLGGACDAREVGGGISTRSALVWSFGERDLAEALACGLVVRARVREEAHLVNKTAALSLKPDVAPDGDGDGDSQAPGLMAIDNSAEGVGAVFQPITPGARLATGDSFLEARALEGENEPVIDDVGRFMIPLADFARSVLRERLLHLEGASFVPSLSVDLVPLASEPPADEAQPAEESPPADEVRPGYKPEPAGEPDDEEVLEMSGEG
jgi:hypothetical protein